MAIYKGNGRHWITAEENKARQRPQVFLASGDEAYVNNRLQSGYKTPPKKPCVLMADS